MMKGNYVPTSVSDSDQMDYMNRKCHQCMISYLVFSAARRLGVDDVSMVSLIDEAVGDNEKYENGLLKLSGNHLVRDYSRRCNSNNKFTGPDGDRVICSRNVFMNDISE